MKLSVAARVSAAVERGAIAVTMQRVAAVVIAALTNRFIALQFGQFRVACPAAAAAKH